MQALSSQISRDGIDTASKITSPFLVFWHGCPQAYAQSRLPPATRICRSSAQTRAATRGFSRIADELHRKPREPDADRGVRECEFHFLKPKSCIVS
jgi:hypothetical protein